MRFLVLAGLTTFLFGSLPDPAEANPLNRWQISCGAGAGAIKRRGKTWTFTESKNDCDSFFAQRAEISPDPIQPSHKEAYLFASTVSMTAAENKRFTLWQVHDSRLGCAPPFQVYVEPSGQLLVTSGVKTGPEESCIRGVIGKGLSEGRLRRDGTKHELKVLIAFDGEGNFDATLWLDGVIEVQGRYQGQDGPYRSRHFYFKHGVYSSRMFDYQLVSENVSVKKVTVGN